LLNELEQKNTRIKNLEEENQDLKNQIKSLISQISHLEIALSKCEASKLAVVHQDDSKAPLAIETASVSSSEGSSIMLVNYPQETREKSLPLASEVESKVALVSLEDEEDEDGWN
jgi:septal ring factor EnvC (AmiA/AmiB activator)